MSAYVKIRTEYRNKAAILTALKRMGWNCDQIKTSHSAINLKGYRGKTRAEKANIIVPHEHVPGAANDIGFELTDDGTYDLHLSEHDKHHNHSLDVMCDGKFESRFRFNYGCAAVEEALGAQGYDLQKEEDEETGDTLIYATRWA